MTVFGATCCGIGTTAIYSGTGIWGQVVELPEVGSLHHRWSDMVALAAPAADHRNR